MHMKLPKALLLDLDDTITAFDDAKVAKRNEQINLQ